MHSVSPKHKRDLDQWYKDIKKQLTSKAHENYFKRLQEIINIANNKLSHYDNKLNVSQLERESMWNGIANDIDSWKGVEITACTKQKTNYKSYAITSRNWWNRNKAKVYGNHFFYPIIFVYIKQAVQNLSIHQEEKNYLFVDIFDEILHAKIQFPQTRAQPIIPHQSFIQPNKFKYSSIDLLKTNGIHWTGKNIDSATHSNHNINNNNTNDNCTGRFSDDDSTSTNSTSSTNNNNNNNMPPIQRQSYYIKDKDRSLKVNNSFMDSLEMLKHRLHQRLVNNGNINNLLNINHFKLKIKTEPGTNMNNIPNIPISMKPSPYFKTENNNNYVPTHCLPPSIKSMKSIRPKQELRGMNITSIAAQSLLQNNNLNNNHNPVIVSPPKYPPTLQLGHIPDINSINITNSNTNFTFPPSLSGSNNNNNVSMDIQSLINSIANGNTSPVSGDSIPTISSIKTQNNPNPPSMNTNPNDMNVLLNTLLMPNQLNYNGTRGQTNSVSNQRFSPNMVPSNILPFNLQNIPNSYCSINTDPVSGQLTLSLHIPLS